MLCIFFDYKLDAEIRQLRSERGSDGALILDANSNIYQVNLTEVTIEIAPLYLKRCYSFYQILAILCSDIKYNCIGLL